MIILPAIDIKDGNCVRLFKGDFNTVHKVAECYMQTAKSFEKSGASWVHMVDLDGAKDGIVTNSDIFIEVAKNTSLKVELGGGIRSLDTVEFYLQNGISRIILGSVALKDQDLVKVACREFGERIAVGIDAINGKVAAEGWVETSDIDYIELAKHMYEYGVRYIIFTDISKDGMLEGPNFKQLDALAKDVPCNIIASGGISNIDDIRLLRKRNLYGAICGKSIYEGTLDLEAAIKLASN